MATPVRAGNRRIVTPLIAYCYIVSRGGVMRRIIPLALACIMLLVLASAALAQEPARYNFASSQGNKEIKVVPGGEGSSVIYFYNIDGNRITHISLEVSQAPADWQVTVQPPLQDTQVEINGQVVTVAENLYVEPSEALSEPVEDTPPGTVCIAVATRGYALAKEVDIIVRVPETAKIGDTGDITISATARWLGQTGSAAVSQDRDFDFSVQVVSGTGEFQETVLGKAESTPETPESTPGTTESPLVPAGSSSNTAESGGKLGNWLPWIIGGAALIVIIILVILYISRRHD
jgi:hypothetical protein